ncbi:MAG: phage late control D family protein [Sphingobium sp.]|nr:phage late control D family protein [Sphingobium sp.]
MPIAAWAVTLNGVDLTDKINPRLLSLSISEKRGEEADQMDLTLHDMDGLLDIPPKGATLKVEMGWRQGTGLPTGMTDKGTYKVDEASWKGPPDQITIRARSADMTDAFRVRRERSFVGKTVKDIVGAIAGDNGLKPQIDAALGAKTIPALGSGAKSDAALLRALGKRFDAVATVKAGTLIFAPIGSGKTASGTQLPTETIDRSQTVDVDYSRVDQDDRAGVSARWHDKKTGTRKSVTVDGGGEGKAKRLRKVYASEEAAKQAAAAENSRLSRSKAKCTVNLPYGRPDIFPERPITLTGFKPEINGHKWVVAECTHSMDGSGGSRTSLMLEALG